MQRSERFAIGTDRADISAFADRLEAWCEARQVPMAVLQAFQIAFDELLTNAIEYGLADIDAPELEVRLHLDDGLLEAEVIDNGAPFDPLDSGTAPDLDSDLDERQVGGLGIHLVRNLMDELRYARSERHNHVFIGKRF